MTDCRRLIEDLESIKSRISGPDGFKCTRAEKESAYQEVEYLSTEIRDLTSLVDQYKSRLADENDIIFELTNKLEEEKGQLQYNKVRHTLASENQESDHVRRGCLSREPPNDRAAMLESRINWQKKEIDFLKAESEALDQDIAKADQLIGGLDRKLDNTEVEIEKCQRNIDRLISEKKNRYDIQEPNNDYDWKLQETAETHQVMLEDLETIQADYTSVMEKLRALSSLCSSLESENDRLTDLLSN